MHPKRSDGGGLIMPLGMKFDKDPFEDGVETEWVTYECGWSNLAPVDEVDEVSDTCQCGAKKV